MAADMSKADAQYVADLRAAFADLPADVMVHRERDGRRSVLVHVRGYMAALAKRDASAPTVAEWQTELEALPDSEWVQGSFRGHPVPRLVRWHQNCGFGYKYSGSWHPATPPSPTTVRLQAALNTDLAQRLHRGGGSEGGRPAGDPLLIVDLASVLKNRYRHGNDSVAAHSDAQPAFGVDPTIASLSAGAARPFDVFPMSDKVREAEWGTRRNELAGLVKRADAQIGAATAKGNESLAAQWRVMRTEAATMLANLSVDTSGPAPAAWVPGRPVRIVIESGDLVLMGGAMQDWWHHAAPKCSPDGRALRAAQPAADATRLAVRHNATFRPFPLPAQAALRFGEARSQ